MKECTEGHYCSSQGLAAVSGQCEAGRNGVGQFADEESSAVHTFVA